jgi:sodium transport system ATP-binding protein
MRDVLFRFIDAEPTTPRRCRVRRRLRRAAMPRPPAFAPLAPAAAPGPAMIDGAGAAKRFTRAAAAARTVQAVDGVSFTAADGRITGLLGPNGAGKTTTLRMVAGLIAPDAGRMRWTASTWPRSPRRALARMGVLSDARGLYPRLTARENIVYYGRLHGMAAPRRRRAPTRWPRLLDMQPLLDRRTEGFSQGERMKTALARALVHDPPNIVLDEPTNGLDVLATRALREALRRLRDDEGKCIVFSTTSCRRWSACATTWWWWRTAAPWPRARVAELWRAPARPTSRSLRAAGLRDRRAAAAAHQHEPAGMIAAPGSSSARSCSTRCATAARC